MKTLFEKAFNSVYSHRINAYVSTAQLAEIYAHEMKNYCEKRGHAVIYEDAYNYAYTILTNKYNKVA